MPERPSIAARLRGLFTHAPHIRTINAFIIIIASALSLMLLRTIDSATAANGELRTATTQYMDCSEAAASLKNASDYLTSNARLFTVTLDLENVHNYYEEVNVTKRRDKAVDVLENYLEDGEAHRLLTSALDLSYDLAAREGKAMRLAAESRGYVLEGDLAPLTEYELTPEEQALGSDEKLALSQEILFGDEYRAEKELIDSTVGLCTSQLIDETHDAQEESLLRLQSLLARQRVLTMLLLVMVLLTIFLVIFLILWPLAAYSALIADNEPLVALGSQELRELAAEYNDLYEKNRRSSDRLRHRADHDALTDLFNRGAYDDLIGAYTTDMALMLIDVDYFKSVNDTYGHEVGDSILKKVARSLKRAFRTSDFACRVGGDEFAVIVTDINPQLKDVVIGKIAQIASEVRDTSDGLPAITLSIGVAFSEQIEPGDTTYKAADRALYLVKERGRNGYAFSDEVNSDLATTGV